ncbi:MAG: 2,3-bisphosphoglycerate-independent phosphoglycerate mutase [archaeon]|nr:MAG: 2,3-bisphosphoglycerate-independent phosphoglycerate mutase [archaeon]
MKAGYVLLDGCADRPDARLNYTTPLDAAYTPNLDRISARASLGRVITVRRGIAPESDIAVFNMLGYSFPEGYPGRGVIEAIGSGLDIGKGDLALRANLASASGRRILDRRAGRNLTQAEAEALQDEINSIKLPGAQLEFRATVSYRGVLVIKDRGPLSASISNTDPAYSKVGGFGAAKKVSPGESIARCIPENSSRQAARAAELINEFTRRALEVLGASQVNKGRVSEGKLPVNCVLLRDAGDHPPKVPSFQEKYGIRGTALVEMPAEVGIAKVLGMKTVAIKDRKDMKEKATLFSKEMKEDTLVYVHIKGPDEFGHDGDAVGKKKNIELIDADFLSKVSRSPLDAKLGVSCDHATPCSIMMHSSDPVPVLMTRAGKGDSMRFTERNAMKGSLGLLAGRDVLGRLLGR